MRRLSKALLSLAVVSAASAAMAVSSMAADTITGTYDAATGVVKIEGAVSTGTSQTLLVLTSDAETVADTDIAQIDQTDDGSVFSQFVLPTGIESGTYFVRIGGDGTIQTGTITIGGGGGEETVQIVIGDVNGDETPDDIDAAYMLRHYGGITDTSKVGTTGTVKNLPADTTLTDSSGNALSSIVLGDVSLDEEVDDTDATYVLRFYAGIEDSSKIGHTGEVVNVLQ